MLDLSRENKVAGKDEWENKIVGVVNPMEKHQGTIKSAEFIPGETGIFFSMDLRLVSFQMVKDIDKRSESYDKSLSQ